MFNKEFFTNRLENLGNYKKSQTLVSSATPQILKVESLANIGQRRTMEDADISFIINSHTNIETLANTMRESMKLIDQESKNLKQTNTDIKGGACSLALALTKDGEAVCASVGDCLAVAYVYNSTTKKVTAHPLNTMHRPDDVEEFKRVRALGGRIILELHYTIPNSNLVPPKILAELQKFTTKENKVIQFEYSEEKLKEMKEVINLFQSLNTTSIVGIVDIIYRVVCGVNNKVSFSRSIGDSGRLISNEPSITITDLGKLAPNPDDKVFLSAKCDGYFDWSTLHNTGNYSEIVESAVAQKMDDRVVDAMFEFASNTASAYGITIRSGDNLTNTTCLIDFAKLGAEDKTHVFALADGHNSDTVAKFFIARFPVLMMSALRSSVDFLIHDLIFKSSTGTTPMNHMEYTESNTALGVVISAKGDASLKDLDMLVKEITGKTQGRQL